MNVDSRFPFRPAPPSPSAEDNAQTQAIHRRAAAIDLRSRGRAPDEVITETERTVMGANNYTVPRS